MANTDCNLLLSLAGVCRDYLSGETQVRALNNINLTIKRGEFLAIMGQSGSGKTTLMNILGCLDTPSSGSYSVDGHQVNTLNVEELSSLRLKTFGFVFQRYQLLANYSAQENVAMPAIYGGMEKNQRLALAKERLAQLGLAERSGHTPSQLSGGQQQRVSIARALINGAQVILADEPTGALDSASGQQVLALLKQLNRDTGTTVVLITHDASVAQQADRIIQMKDGHITSDSGQHQLSGDAPSPLSNSTQASPFQASPKQPIKRYPRISLWESLCLALGSLQANLFRTLLTLLGIIIGVASVVTMMAIGDGGKQQVLQRIEAMGTNLLQIRPGGRNIRASGEIATLTMEDAQFLAQLPGIAAFSPEREARTTVRYGSNDYSGRARGITPAYFSMRNWEIAQGVFINNDDVERYSSVIVIGATVAEQLFPNTQNPIGEYVLMNNSFYQVIGTLKAKGASAGGRDIDDEVYIPITTAQLKLFGRPYLSSVIVKVSSTDLLPTIEATVTQELKRRHGREDFMVRNTATLVEAISETQDTLTWMLGSVAAISLFVGGIGVMNIMLVNVSERRREIGLRIATGAKPSDILRQFNIEALMVCLLGGLIGVGLGLFISLVLQQAAIAVAFSLAPPLLAFTTSLLVGVIFGYAPAHKAASLNPIQALAEE